MAAGQTRKTGVSVSIAVGVSVSGKRAFFVLSRRFRAIRPCFRAATVAYSASIQTPPTHSMEPRGT